jgi:hypothetical protein
VLYKRRRLARVQQRSTATVPPLNKFIVVEHGFDRRCWVLRDGYAALQAGGEQGTPDRKTAEEHGRRREVFRLPHFGSCASSGSSVGTNPGQRLGAGTARCWAETASRHRLLRRKPTVLRERGLAKANCLSDASLLILSLTGEED